MYPRCDTVGFGWGDLGRMVNPLSSPLSPIGQARGIYSAAKRGPGALLNPLSSPFSPFGQTRAIINVARPVSKPAGMPANSPVYPDAYYPPMFGQSAQPLQTPSFPPFDPTNPYGGVPQYATPTGAPGYDWTQFQAPMAPQYDWGVPDSGSTGWDASYGSGQF